MSVNITIGVDELLRLIDINRGQFEYWRRLLDPDKKRKRFLYSHIYSYMIMKKAIKNYFFRVSRLKSYDWEFIFDACSTTEPDKLIELDFIFDIVDERVLLLGKNDKRPSPRNDGELKVIPMINIFDYLADNDFKEYDAHILYSIIGVDRYIFYRWKKYLDVNPKRKKFNDGDFIAYWAMYWLCGHGQHPLIKLGQEPAWAMVFDACQNMPLSELKGCAIAVRWQDRKLFFLKSDEIIAEPIEGYHYICFQRILKSYSDGMKRLRRIVSQNNNDS